MESADLLYKQQIDAKCVIATLANGIHALLGCDSAGDFVRFAKNVRVSIDAVDVLQTAYQSSKVPLEVRRLPSDTQGELAKHPFTYLPQVMKCISKISLSAHVIML